MTEASGHAPPAVYRAIAAVAGAIASKGIAKDKRNSQQGYNFRGIDDVYNALAPILSEAGLVVLPRVLNRLETERETKSGGALFNVVVEVEFDFVAAEDGSHHVVKTFGEAMDSADKATNKAMSAAYKYAAMQAFCIPTSGDNDADATSHEVAPRRQAPATQAPARRAPTRQPLPVRPASPASQAPAQPQQVAQPQQQAAGGTQPTTAAMAYLRCQQAGLTEAGMRAMATEISKGATAAVAGLSEATQHKLATTGVPEEWVQKYNAAGAALTDDDPDLPRTWDAPAAA
ncbi:hypothetical protein LBMAG40_09010 [Cyanobium sp.]|nr:hypothetical protein LBMAG40_09010 [Cyanobium sp.]